MYSLELFGAILGASVGVVHMFTWLAQQPSVKAFVLVETHWSKAGIRNKPMWSAWDSAKESDQSLEEEVKFLRDCVYALQRMVLHTEDFMSCLRSELSWAMFFRLDMKATVVPALFEMQQHWRDLKAQSPETLTGPMRMALVTQLFKELGTRLEKFHEQEELVQTVKNMGWYNLTDRTWYYVKWDADNERLTRDETKDPVGFERLAAIFASIQQLAVVPDTVMRCHPSRPLEETMGGRSVTFALQLCILGDSSKQFREHLKILTRLAVTQLVGTGLRPERPNRSTLATMIQKQTQEINDKAL